MTLVFRWLIFATLTAATVIGASRDTGWHMGTFRIEGADDEGWNGFGVSGARHSPGNQSYNPLTESVVFDIGSEGRSYRASITGVPIDRSVTPEELFPWLRDVPPQVRFRIKGKTIYFLDLKNKQHKAEILRSPEPHSSRKSGIRSLQPSAATSFNACSCLALSSSIITQSNAGPMSL